MSPRMTPSEIAKRLTPAQRRAVTRELLDDPGRWGNVLNRITIMALSRRKVVSLKFDGEWWYRLTTLGLAVRAVLESQEEGSAT